MKKKTRIIYENNASVLTNIKLKNFDLQQKYYGTMEKNYGSIPKTIYGILIYSGKYVGTIVNYSWL